MSKLPSRYKPLTRRMNLVFAHCNRRLFNITAHENEMDPDHSLYPQYDRYLYSKIAAIKARITATPEQELRAVVKANDTETLSKVWKCLDVAADHTKQLARAHEAQAQTR
jgi:hypothetical protein